MIIIIIIIIFINCNWVVTRWQWLFYMYTNMEGEGNVTRKFKSGGLHEKHVVATWKLGNHLSICLKTQGNQEKPVSIVYMHVLTRLYLVTQPVRNVSFGLELKAVEDKGIMFLQNVRKSLSSDIVSYPRRIQSSLLVDNCMVFILTPSSQIYRQHTLLLYIYPKRYELYRCK